MRTAPLRFIFLLLLFSIVCINSGVQSKPKMYAYNQRAEPLPIIEISSISMDILTRAKVDCSTFDTRFEGEKKFKTIKGKRQVEKFLKNLQALERGADWQTDTDTRALIVLRYPDHEEKLCADKFVLCNDEGCYKMTDYFKKLIW